MVNQLALHESLEVHEITAFKNVCLTKNKLMQALAADPALKQILQRDIQVSTRQIQELNRFLGSACQ
jgi:similar to spore coat protein